MPAPVIGSTRPPGVETIPIIDFGSQYAQLIARRVRSTTASGVLTTSKGSPCF